jgi:hypothetical protein
MKNHPLSRLFLAICFFLLLMSAAAAERPAYAQCESVTDASIVSSIYASIKNDKSLSTQIRHINVTSTNRAVKFQGWADSQKSYDKVIGFAMDHGCVRAVNVNSFEAAAPPEGNQLRSAGGCASGTKPCGDLCIPEADICNIGAETGN